MWKLIQSVDRECTIDNSGVYTIINRTHFGPANFEKLGVRCDIMTTDGDKPLVSFIGLPNAVRKDVARWLHEHRATISSISTEHAGYIGYELMRAYTHPGFVQI